MSLTRRESRADFPEVSLQLLDPATRRLVVHSGFNKLENRIVLDTCAAHRQKNPIVVS